MAEARLHRDEVIDEGKKSEGPCEQNCTGDALFERQCEAKESCQAEEAVVEDAERLVPHPEFDGVRDADPIEIEALQCKLREPKFVRSDILLRELSFMFYIGQLSH